MLHKSFKTYSLEHRYVSNQTMSHCPDMFCCDFPLDHSLAGRYSRPRTGRSDHEHSQYHSLGWTGRDILQDIENRLDQLAGRYSRTGRSDHEHSQYHSLGWTDSGILQDIENRLDHSPVGRYSMPRTSRSNHEHSQYHSLGWTDSGILQDIENMLDHSLAGRVGQTMNIHNTILWVGQTAAFYKT